jgi:DNA-binding transcriptional regulator YhcF (GntR family)
MMSVILREKLKEVYQKMRKQDAVEVGRKVNALVQQIHTEKRVQRETQSRNPEKLASLVEQIKELTFEKRFRDEFPDLPSFKAYVKKEKLSIKDLSMM